MFIHHPYQKIRDLVEYRYFRKVTHGQRPTLHRLADLLLGLKVKSDEIDGVSSKPKPWNKAMTLCLHALSRIRSK